MNTYYIVDVYVVRAFFYSSSFLDCSLHSRVESWWHSALQNCTRTLVMVITRNMDFIPLPTKAGRWQMVWHGPRLGFVAETGRYVATSMETPWVRFFCLLAFVPFFLLHVFRFSFLIFFPASRYLVSSSCPFVCSAAICYSPKYVFYSTCSFCLRHLYRTSSRNSLVFYFVAVISRVAFFLLCLALDLPNLNLKRLIFLCLRYHRICIALGSRIRKDTGADVG